MNVYSFDSIEEMNEALDRWNAEANEGLATEQKAITYGDYWVRFYDVGARVVDFAKVATEAEMAQAEMESGTDPDEIAGLIAAVTARHDSGYLFGRAHSILSTEGEWGYTHRANVWPIEERLYTAAEMVDWKIDNLNPAGRLLLEIAYACYRTHLREVGGRHS